MSTQNAIQEIQDSAVLIRSRCHSFEPEIGIILGSGMGMLADEVQDAIKISYRDIPGFPVPTVEGHAGSLVMGMLAGKRVCVMQGRFHFYEGHSATRLAFPVRVMHELGVKTLIVTNAAGGVNPDYKPGDFMLIRDHLNFTFHNPLIGPNLESLGPRFPDTSCIYDRALIAKAHEVATQLNLSLREGVYLFMTGPSYETPAEIRLARKIGADAVGMSTFPEAIAATHCGIRVLGMSYISNLGAGIGEGALSHQEVIETTTTIRDTFILLLTSILRAI
jgi:purine-nucleoside phosphorylase